jgi:hypothetical protein
MGQWFPTTYLPNKENPMFSSKSITKVVTLISILIMTMSSVQPAYAAPSNDNFADATQVASLAYSTNTDTTGATFEDGEPYPTCGYGYTLKTAWFTFTASTAQSLTASIGYYNFPTVLAVYTGSSLNSLSQIGCSYWYNNTTFQAQAGVTYYFQISGLYGDEGIIPFSLIVTPPPQVSINYSPGDPSVYDNVYIYANVYDPAQVYGNTYAWTVDGTTSDQQSFNHQFAADGDYPVTVSFTTYDGRSASADSVIQVRTRDVSINKLSIPQTARVNQTKAINVDIKNNRYSDYVQVTLIKGLPGGGEQTIGYLILYVPARDTRPTTFKFSYTFTSDDANVGKVVFKAVATLVNGRDALPSDNTAIGITLVTR